MLINCWRFLHLKILMVCCAHPLQQKGSPVQQQLLQVLIDCSSLRLDCDSQLLANKDCNCQSCLSDGINYLPVPHCNLMLKLQTSYLLQVGCTSSVILVLPQTSWGNWRLSTAETHGCCFPWCLLMLKLHQAKAWGHLALLQPKVALQNWPILFKAKGFTP